MELGGESMILGELTDHLLMQSVRPEFPAEFYVQIINEENDDLGIDDTNNIQYFSSVPTSKKEPFLIMGLSDTSYGVTMALLRAIGKRQ